MRHLRACLTVVLLVSISFPAGLVAQRGQAVGPPTTPVPGSAQRHAQFLEVAKQGGIELLFIGDSITDWWRSRGLAVWEKTWAPLKAANFGVAGERVEHLLWRVQNGELEGFSAKLVVLMIGTNNLRGTTANQDIVDGITLLTGEILKRQPDANLLLLGIFPRDAAPDTERRQRIKDINASLVKLQDGKRVFYLDIGPKLLEADGTLSVEVMNDGLHPTAKGYQIWADATLARVKELMGVK